MTRLGLVADTHDLVRPELLEVFAEVDAILHAGDVCNARVHDELAAIAPVTAVRGNNDHGDWAAALPEAVDCRFEGVRIWMLHDRQDLPRLPSPDGTDLVVVGHSHRPEMARLKPDGPCLINPGSAGRRRFRLPITCALLDIDGNRMQADHHELVVLPPSKSPPTRSRRARR